MNKSKIEKIKKLLNTTGRTEEETSAFLAMAKKLMDSEGLSTEDITKYSIDDELGELGDSWLNDGEEKRLLNWKKVLLSNLAYFFDCRIINHTINSKNKILIVGRESNRITCQMMYNWIHDRTMKEARELYGSQTAKRNSYCVGVANGIATKVHQLKGDISKPNGWGIVPINEVDAYMKSKFSNLRNRSISTTVSDRQAMSAGRKVGENTSLNNQFGLKAICA